MKLPHGCRHESVMLNKKSDSINRHITAKFHSDPIWNDRTLGFLKTGCPPKKQWQDEYRYEISSWSDKYMKWRYGCHCEITTSDQKSNCINQCIFVWGTFLLKVILIPFEMMEQWHEISSWSKSTFNSCNQNTRITSAPNYEQQVITDKDCNAAVNKQLIS